MLETFKEILSEFDDLPRFSDGRINYSGSRRAAVLMCFVSVGDEILLLKRSDKVGSYQGKWNGVGGFVDEPVPITEKVFEELREELGVTENLVFEVIVREPFESLDAVIDREWIIFPVLVRLKYKPEIVLDWEYVSYEWILPENLLDFDVVAGLDKTLARALGE